MLEHPRHARCAPRRDAPLASPRLPPLQVEQFRGGAAYAAFLKKWNLPVYFSLRFQVGG